MFEQTGNYLRHVNAVMFAVYLSLLLIMANAVRSILHSGGDYWIYRLCLVMTGVRRPASYEDPGLRFAFFFLWMASAAVVFLIVWLLSRFSFVRIFLRVFAGIVAVVGFPIANGYASFRAYLDTLGSLPQAFLYAYAPHRWLGVEVLASLVGIFLYVFVKWPKKAMWGLLLLFLHFALWSWLVLLGAGSGNILLWPGYSWTRLTRENPSLIYPLLGVLTSLVWGLYLRKSVERPESPK